MVWNKTPEEVLVKIFDKLLDFSLRYQDIAKMFGVSKDVVYNTWHSKATAEQKAARYSGINHYAKLGSKNHMQGKTKDKHPASKTNCIVCGYDTVWAPDWWTGTYPKNNRVYTHQLNWCLANNQTGVPAGFIIHHKDHNKLNNDASNLELMTRSTHMTYHATERATTRRKAVENSILEVQSILTKDGDIV